MAQLAAESGISNFSNFFVNDPNSAIQWPFAVGVPISYGFGMRSGRMHEGVDFTPGAGLADPGDRRRCRARGDETRAARTACTSSSTTSIDGQLVSSHYAHMQYGSLQVQVGQQVTVGTILGRTGNTGRSYGAHTHFEILMNGTTPIDPIPVAARARRRLTPIQGDAGALVFSSSCPQAWARPDSSVVEHFHGKEGVVSSILTRGSQHPVSFTGCCAAG